MQVLDTQNTVRMEIRCTIQRSCLIDLNIVVPEALRIPYLQCFITGQVLHVIDLMQSTEWNWDNLHILLRIISVKYLLIQSTRPLLKGFPRYFHNEFSIPHCRMLMLAQVCMYKKRVVIATYIRHRKPFAGKILIAT